MVQLHDHGVSCSRWPQGNGRRCAGQQVHLCAGRGHCAGYAGHSVFTAITERLRRQDGQLPARLLFQHASSGGPSGSRLCSPVPRLSPAWSFSCHFLDGFDQSAPVKAKNWAMFAGDWLDPGALLATACMGSMLEFQAGFYQYPLRHIPASRLGSPGATESAPCHWASIPARASLLPSPGAATRLHKSKAVAPGSGSMAGRLQVSGGVEASRGGGRGVL